MDENQFSRIRFEYVDSTGYSTIVEKQYPEGGDHQFNLLLLEVRNCLLACGFSEGLVNQYLPDTI